ncbi:UPF0158 family protein [Chondromyces crocatus]|uniref:Uncharacterized protein n=1 Tax=Chondromyces crocatus TaxID=52 RepID=A0A0K1E7H5_CHOCO|nr:UPF0158 family protein [Chondromyces crocatus]AKT36815.1 uncharacterized protein CMC5_009360 [Chondromyces crocatus]
MPNNENPSAGGAAMRDIPIDWEALEDAFENNAPEVHSYLHLSTGDVLRVVDGVADPQMHARIASDLNYLRIDPVSSREQYRWMERYIPMVEDPELQGKLTQAIDGKGAFRRFKDVLMQYGPERERWFAFRSERLRIFMEAWLNAHALTPVARPMWVPEPSRPGQEAPPVPEHPEPREVRRGRSVETLRKNLREIAEALGPRDLDTLTAFAEFLKARRAARSFAQHHQFETPHHDEDVGPASHESHTSVTSDAELSHASSKDGPESAESRIERTPASDVG